MSRHHPYAGYDEARGSGFMGGGHRKHDTSGPHPTRGGFGSPGPRSGRRGGHGRPRSNWGSDGGYGDFGEFGNDFVDPHVPHGPSGGSKSGKVRGGLRGKAKGTSSRADIPDRDLSIDERIQRERPCRTLFVRNVKYETNSMEVREKFERMGEIKTFFDLIPNRGMVFITYYDLRAATMAKEQLQGSDVSGRPIDVHYSLPKDNELERRCDRDKNQATLFLAISGANRVIDDDELHAKFSRYGEIRSIKHFKDSPYQRFVEFWDSRACEQAHDELVGSHYLGGKLDLKFSWDTGMVPRTRLPRELRGGDHQSHEYPGGYEYHGHDYGPNTRNGFDSYGGGQMNDGFGERRDSFGRGPSNGVSDLDHLHSSSSSFGQEYPNSWGIRGPSGSNAINPRFNDTVNPFGPSTHHPSSMTHNQSAQALAGGGLPHLTNSGGDRLDQAHKVQDLLAALTKPKDSAPASSLSMLPTSQLNLVHAPSVPMTVPTAPAAYGSTVPTAVTASNHPASYPSILPNRNDYQPHLTASSDPQPPVNSSYGPSATQVHNTTTVAPALQAHPSMALPNLHNVTYSSILDQTRLNNATQSNSTATSHLTPALLALLSQTSTTTSDSTAREAARAQDMPGAHPLSNTYQSTPASFPYVTSASASNAAIPAGPRAMQTNPAYTGYADAAIRTHLPVSANIPNGTLTTSASVIPTATAAASVQPNSNGPSAVSPNSTNQAAVQQLLALLQQQQQQQQQNRPS